jgi:transposase
MPKPYSRDLRERVIASIEAGASRREAAELYGISPSVVVIWAQQWKATGSIEAKPSGSSISPLEDHAAFLLGLVIEHPDMTLDEVVTAMSKVRIAGSRTAVWRFYERLLRAPRCEAIASSDNKRRTTDVRPPPAAAASPKISITGPVAEPLATASTCSAPASPSILQQSGGTRRRNWRLILRVFLPFTAAFFFSYLFRTINALISSELRSALALDAADLGFLTSVYFLTFAALQLPVGIWLDRYGPRRVQGALPARQRRIRSYGELRSNLDCTRDGKEGVRRSLVASCLLRNISLLEQRQLYLALPDR